MFFAVHVLLLSHLFWNIPALKVCTRATSFRGSRTRNDSSPPTTRSALQEGFVVAPGPGQATRTSLLVTPASQSTDEKVAAVLAMQAKFGVKSEPMAQNLDEKVARVQAMQARFGLTSAQPTGSFGTTRAPSLLTAGRTASSAADNGAQLESPRIAEERLSLMRKDHEMRFARAYSKFNKSLSWSAAIAQEPGKYEDLLQQFDSANEEDIESTFQEWLQHVVGHSSEAETRKVRQQLQQGPTSGDSVKWHRLSVMRQYMFQTAFTWASAMYYRMANFLGDEVLLRDGRDFIRPMLKRQPQNLEEESCYLGAVAAGKEMQMDEVATADLADVALEISEENDHTTIDSNAAIAMLTAANSANMAAEDSLGSEKAAMVAGGVVAGAVAVTAASLEAINHASNVSSTLETIHDGAMVAASFGGHVTTTMGVAIDTGIAQAGMALLQIRRAGKTDNACHKKVKMGRAGAFATSVACGLLGAALMPICPIASIGLLATKGSLARSFSVMLTSDDVAKLSGGRLTSLEDRLCDKIDDPKEFPMKKEMKSIIMYRRRPPRSSRNLESFASRALTLL